MNNQQPNNHTLLPYPLMSVEERMRAWAGIRGMWKNRKPDPIKELKKIRKELDRKLPKLGPSRRK